MEGPIHFCIYLTFFPTRKVFHAAWVESILLKYDFWFVSDELPHYGTALGELFHKLVPLRGLLQFDPASRDAPRRRGSDLPAQDPRLWRRAGRVVKGRFLNCWTTQHSVDDIGTSPVFETDAVFVLILSLSIPIICQDNERAYRCYSLEMILLWRIWPSEG
jgi:hypothetical protein